jgi:hypothetical protein
MDDRPPFVPLSEDAYQALSAKEKIAYLNRAIEDANWRVVLQQQAMEREAQESDGERGSG